MTDYLTRLERFRTGDYPMVCVRTGLPADKLVPVQAERRAENGWWLFLGIIPYLIAAWPRRGDDPWGLLPFATGHVGGIDVTYHPSRHHIIRIRGAHADFADAVQADQAELSASRN